MQQMADSGQRSWEAIVPGFFCTPVAGEFQISEHLKMSHLVAWEHERTQLYISLLCKLTALSNLGMGNLPTDVGSRQR